MKLKTKDGEIAYRAAMLAGRCTNGYARDSGTLAHALPEGLHVALCGASYGKRSAGWSTWDEDAVTCSPCMKFLAELEQP